MAQTAVERHASKSRIERKGNLMFSGIYLSITILAMIATFSITDWALILRYDKQRRAEGSAKSWDLTITMIIAAIFLITQPTLLSWMGLHTNAWWGILVQTVGILLALGGLGLHWWSRTHLQQFYAERAEVQPGHHLVDSGPYAYVRHPRFRTYLMFASGLLLLNPALPSLIIVIYTFWDFARAARQGEKLLAEDLPDYIDYMAHTPRFLPKFRKHSKGRQS